MSEGARSGAWAAQLVRDTYGDADRSRNERFLENALIDWLEQGENRWRFLAVLGRGDLHDSAVVLERQFSDEDGGRADIRFFVDDEQFSVELKLWAQLTRAQRSEDYADVFLVPRGRMGDISRDVSGAVMSWEDLFLLLDGDGHPESSELNRLRTFYEGLAFGANLVEWPDDPDGRLLDEFRSTGRALVTELLDDCHSGRLDWTADGGFELRNPSTGITTGVVPGNDELWWEFTEETGWIPVPERGSLSPHLTRLAQAFSAVWTNVAKIGLGEYSRGWREFRLDDDEGWVFGRWWWRGGYAVEVMLTFGDHDDSRVVGIVVWDKHDGDWRFIREAWWPKAHDSAFDEWSEEAVRTAKTCADGDIDGAFDDLRHAVASGPTE